MTPKDRTVMALVGLVGIFVVGSMVLIIVAGFNGQPTSKVWAGLFSMMTAILGAVAGWLGGASAATRAAPPAPSSGEVEADGDLG